MTTETMNLQALLEKTTDPDFLREMIGFTAQRLMALGVETLTGVPIGSSMSNATIRSRFAVGMDRDQIRPRNGYQWVRREKLQNSPRSAGTKPPGDLGPRPR
jgi:hypothetical protein